MQRDLTAGAGLTIRPGLTIPATELVWRFSRSSGPGGQSVNTADSRVELRLDLERSQSVPEPFKSRALSRLQHRLIDGSLSITASEHRGQLQNRRAALARLAALLNEAIAPDAPQRHPTRPSRSAIAAARAAKGRRSQLKRLRAAPGDGD